MNKEINVLMIKPSIIPHTNVYKIDVANQLKTHGSSMDNVYKPVILRSLLVTLTKQLVNVLNLLILQLLSTTNIPLTNQIHPCLTAANVYQFLLALQELCGIHIISNVHIEKLVKQEKPTMRSNKGVYIINHVYILNTTFMTSV